MSVLATAQEDMSVEWAEILVGLTPNGLLPRPGTPRREVLEFAADRLARDRLFEPDIHEPRWLTETMVERLAEAAQGDSSLAREHSGRRVATPSAESKALVDSLPIVEDLRTRCSFALKTDVAAVFLYYESGEWLPLHVDNRAIRYDCNLLVPLSATPPKSGKGSATYFVLQSDRIAGYRLEPGVAAWFHAGFTPHGRTPLTEGESVTLLSLGLGTAR
jgi:hypothetical protein